MSGSYVAYVSFRCSNRTSEELLPQTHTVFYCVSVKEGTRYLSHRLSCPSYSQRTLMKMSEGKTKLILNKYIEQRVKNWRSKCCQISLNQTVVSAIYILNQLCIFGGWWVLYSIFFFLPGGKTISECWNLMLKCKKKIYSWPVLLYIEISE